MCKIGEKRKKLYNVVKRLFLLIVIVCAIPFYIVDEISNPIYFGIYGFALSLAVLWNFKEIALSIRTQARYAENLIAANAEERKYLFYRIYIVILNICISIAFAYFCYFVRDKYIEDGNIYDVITHWYVGYKICKGALNSAACYLIFGLTKIKRKMFGETVVNNQFVKRDIEMDEMTSREISYNEQYIDEIA